MLDELKTENKTVGLKQSIKVVKAGAALKAFVAKEADLHVSAPFVACCEQQQVPVEYCETCAELGQACGIDVGAAIAVLTK